MRTLRFRILWMLAVVALIPLGILGAFSHRIIIEETATQNRERFERALDAAQTRVEDHLRMIQGAVGHLSEPAPLIDELLLDRAAGRFGPERQERFVNRLVDEMHARGMDVLTVVDLGEQRILGAGHFPGQAGAPADDWMRLPRDEVFARPVRIRDEGQTFQEQSILFGQTVERDGVRVLIVGGRVLSPSYVQDLLGYVESVRLELVERSEVAASPNQRAVYSFRQASQEQPGLHIVAILDDADLQLRRQSLLRTLAIAAAMSFLAVAILGWLLSASIRAPLRRLETAAVRVGEGDLDFKVPVKGNDEVAKSLQAFNAMTKQLRSAQRRLLRTERIAAWREIARRIAHEIKNPLSPIQVSIETMRKTYSSGHPDFDEIFEESTVTILEEVERLKRIVTEFSEFARMPGPKPEELDVRDVVDHVVSLYGGSQVRLSVRSEDELPRIRADREQLTQVLINLVQNAIDAASALHGTKGGEVLVGLAPRRDGVEIIVRDNGPGIPPDQRVRVFEPYFTTKSTGTGLGLAIAHRIVGDHGGHIEVDDAEGGGAEIQLWLPRCGPSSQAEASTADATMSFIHR